MGNSLLAWVNTVKTGALSASNAEPTLPVTNLAIDQGSTASAWQTQAGVLSATLTITPTARTAIQIVGAFRTNFTSAATMVATGYTNPGMTLVFTTATVGFVNGQAVAVLTPPIAADVVQIVFSDATNPDNHLNIPLAFAGPAWQPLTAASWSSQMGRDEVSDTVTTRGGQKYVDLRASARRWEISLDGVRGAEAFSQLDVLDRFARIGGNAMFIPNLTSAYLQNEATFGILDPAADVTFPLGIGDRRSWRARLVERL